MLWCLPLYIDIVLAIDFFNMSTVHSHQALYEPCVGMLKPTRYEITLSDGRFLRTRGDATTSQAPVNLCEA